MITHFLFLENMSLTGSRSQLEHHRAALSVVKLDYGDSGFAVIHTTTIVDYNKLGCMRYNYEKIL